MEVLIEPLFREANLKSIKPTMPAHGEFEYLVLLLLPQGYTTMHATCIYL